MRGDVHAIHPDRPGTHKATRSCPCGPAVHRDLSTGRLTVWVHKLGPTIYPAQPYRREAP